MCDKLEDARQERGSHWVTLGIYGCVFPRVSLNGRRYIRQFSVDDRGGSMFASFGFSAKASKQPRISPDSSVLTAVFLLQSTVIN